MKCITLKDLKHSDIVPWVLHSKNVFKHDLLLEVFDHNKCRLVGASLFLRVRVYSSCYNLRNNLCRFVVLTPVCSHLAGFVIFYKVHFAVTAGVRIDFNSWMFLCVQINFLLLW